MPLKLGCIEKDLTEVFEMIELNKDNCDAEVLQEKNMPVVVDFWGPTCPECLALMPHYEALEKKFGAKIKFTKVDCSKKRSVAMKFRVMGMPTFIFFKNGAEVKRMVREQCTAETIKTEIETLTA